MRRLITLFALLAAAAPANAGLSVCNKTPRLVVVALGRFDGAQWGSEGWWHVRPKTCAKLVSEPLKARFYYLFATDGFFGTWDGDKNFCVGVIDKFTAAGRGACAAHGFDRRGFFEVDTGNRLDWMQPLSN